ncbi:putative 26S proteasome non-ATPase regulatory subunit 3 [Hibiscus syriacus]|uniref:26S proteasome non-ATPase regulatory subunit 3 n=1 Tax=Hibiscus syriacus TaxID=106335 RepID=A0A6A3B3H8_HIBSY|nr:putative 26S proteasome non-ATPase regulatory subunit 3 [Hibiscus syriacus]
MMKITIQRDSDGRSITIFMGFGRREEGRSGRASLTEKDDGIKEDPVQARNLAFAGFQEFLEGFKSHSKPRAALENGTAMVDLSITIDFYASSFNGRDNNAVLVALAATEKCSETHILHVEGLSVKMSRDVEMKPPPTSLSSADLSALLHLKEIASLIESTSYTEEVRCVVRAVRLTFGLRRKLTAPLLSAFLDFVLQPGSEAHSRLSSFLPKEDEHSMDVDTVTSDVPTPTKYLLPELEIYCYLLVLLFLIDQKKYNEIFSCPDLFQAKACSSASINRLKNPSRRTLDILASRLYFYYSYSYELTGDLAKIRGNLLALHRITTRNHNELSQETLLNLLLRNYLHYNLYDQAEKLRSKAPRLEAQSNQQFCRYLFYLGKIRTIRLEYTDAKESLLQAARKSPVVARGFRIQCNKWAILVSLLLGEIPERKIFVQKGMDKALRPYLELTNAVRICDLELFQSVAVKFTSTFSTDKTQNLIVRLRHNVIRTGLRNISISYSCISLADVAEKLRLNSETPVADAERIVAKAIRDGAIDATLDHANGWMVSREIDDIYSTNEPQTAFHSRIAFCLNMHNEAVQAMYFPPKTLKEKESA